MNNFKKHLKDNSEILVVMLIVGTVVELSFPLFKLDPNNWFHLSLGAVLPTVAITIMYDIVRKRYRKHKKE